MSKTTLGWMGGIAGVAMLLAILRHGLRSWGRGELVTLNLGILILASIPMALHGPSLRRAFWDGFAGFGWFYLIVNAGPWSLPSDPPPTPIARCFDALRPWIHPEDRSRLPDQDSWNMEAEITQSRLRYHSSCHAIASLLCGLLGGLMFRFFATRREQRQGLEPAAIERRPDGISLTPEP